MALRDYILCKNCKCKLIPDGNDLVREHLEEKWGAPEADYYTPMLLCPDCVAALEQEVGGLVKASEAVLGEIEDIMQEAFSSAYLVCCGRHENECCGLADLEWNAADQRMMERLEPHQKALKEALAAAPAVQVEPVAFCEDAVLTLAERTFSTEIDEQMAEDIIQFAQRLHSSWVSASKEQGDE